MRYLLLLWLVSSLALMASPVQAQAGIGIVQSDTQTDFPDALTFRLVVQGDVPIKEITLRYQVEKVTHVSVVSETKLDFTPGERVEASWRWDMRKASLPPGAMIRYSWIIKDAQGGVLRTDPANVIFEDGRYSWNSLAEGKITLLWYKGDQDFAGELMKAAQGALTRLVQDTGAELKNPVRIYIYESAEALSQALIFPREWTGGVAFTEYGIVLIGISSDSSGLIWGKRALPHELTHLLVHQVTFSPYSEPPTWLDEGLATYAEGELRNDMQLILQKTIADDSLISVSSLASAFPADPKQALLSYAESGSVVTFLIKEYGRDKMLQFLESFGLGDSSQKALQQVYGFDVEELDARWRTGLGLSPRPSPTARPTLTTTPTPTTDPTVTHTAVATATPTTSPTPKSVGGLFSCSSSSEASSTGSWAWVGVFGLLAGAFLLSWRRRN